MGEIKISKKATDGAKSEFEGAAEDIRSLTSEVDAAESDLFGSFKGGAADAAKDLLSVLDECLKSLADSYETHSVSLENASQTFQDVDLGLAESQLK